jgi:hypothetical protein
MFELGMSGTCSANLMCIYEKIAFKKCVVVSWIIGRCQIWEQLFLPMICHATNVLFLSIYITAFIHEA